MRLRRWSGLGATAGLIGVVGFATTQTGHAAGKSKPSWVDPMAVSDAVLEGSIADRRLPAGVEPPDGVREWLANKDGTIAVMVELDGEPAAVTYGRANRGGPAARGPAVAAARTQLAAIEQAQRTILSGLPSNSTVLYRVKRAYNGIAVRMSVRDLAAVKRMQGVKAIHRLVPKALSNWNSVPFIGAPTAWTSGTGYTGTGIKVGVIDT